MALAIEKLNKDSKIVSQKLSCGIEIILTLIKIKAKLPDDQYEILRSYLSPTVDNNS